MGKRERWQLYLEGALLAMATMVLGWLCATMEGGGV